MVNKRFMDFESRRYFFNNAFYVTRIKYKDIYIMTILLKKLQIGYSDTLNAPIEQSVKYKCDSHFFNFVIVYIIMQEYVQLRKRTEIPVRIE